MREIIHVQVCGVLGHLLILPGRTVRQPNWKQVLGDYNRYTDAWLSDTLKAEHSIDETGQFTGVDSMQRERLDVYFSETSSSRYVPRSVLVDLEPGALDVIKSGSIGGLFKPDSYVTSASGNSAGNNWAKGHYTEGSEMIDEVWCCFGSSNVPTDTGCTPSRSRRRRFYARIPTLPLSWWGYRIRSWNLVVI
jgi:hypothetical protein